MDQNLISDRLIVALGDRRYEVARPWGSWPVPGKVTDVAVGSRDDVFVLVRNDPYVDGPADCVVHLDDEGSFLKSWGKGRILDAHKLACDREGRIWVVDRDAHEIVAFDPEGREVAALGGRNRPLEPFNHPSDIAFGPDGSIAVADGYAGGRVHIFEADGRPRTSWGEVGTAPGQFMTAHGIWVLTSGAVALADRENARVQLFAPDGALTAVLTGYHRPSDIWGDAADRLFVSDGIPTLSLLTPEGRRLGRCRPVLNGAHGIAGDARGRLYLAEGNPSRLTRLEPVM